MGLEVLLFLEALDEIISKQKISGLKKLVGDFLFYP